MVQELRVEYRSFAHKEVEMEVGANNRTSLSAGFGVPRETWRERLVGSTLNSRLRLYLHVHFSMVELHVSRTKAVVNLAFDHCKKETLTKRQTAFFRNTDEQKRQIDYGKVGLNKYT